MAGRLVRRLAEPPEGEELLRPSRAWLLAIPSAYVIAVGGSVLYGTPAKLPGVALGLPLLLDLERAAAVLTVTAGVLIFALLTSRGQLRAGFVERSLSHKSSSAFRAHACQMLRLLDIRFAATCRYRGSLMGRRSQRCAPRSRRCPI
jgi:hypothetical protein